MDQLKKLLATLSLRQRTAIVATALLAGGGIWSFSRWKQESDFRPLYSTMAPEDAAAVVQKLKASNVPFRLSDSGSSVLVPSAKVAEARLELAAAGIPKTGRIGYELFDKTNFGATEFVEHINYQRALEGELERSVMSLAEVERARVHLTFAKDSVYLDAKQPAKASVMVKLRPGARLSPQNALAICHLVASAVEGLDPGAVSVLDMNGVLLNRPRKASTNEGGEPSDEMLEVQQKIERDLVAKIRNTLEPLLGPDKFQAAASVECDLTSGEQSEETYDPAKTVTINSQKTEDVSGGNEAAGVPGTASNLPRPTSRPGVVVTNVSRRTENITYQPSRMVRRTRLPQGAIKRLSLSVLLDQEVRWEGTGSQAHRVVVPPSPATLKTIRDLVAGATGFNASRGDQLILESLPFESTLRSGAPPETAPAPAPRANPWQRLTGNPRILFLVVVGAVAFLALAGGLGFLFMRKRRPRKAAANAQATLEDSGRPGTTAGLPKATGEKQIEAANGQMAEKDLEEEVLSSLKRPQSNRTKVDVLSKHVRAMVKNDSAAVAQVLRTWLEEK